MGIAPDTMRIALAGCGAIAHVHGEAVDEFDQASIVACADINPGNARQFAERFRVPAFFSSLETMIEQSSFDVLFLTTWPNLHLDQIRTACSMGVKAIFCEKPLARSGTEADEIMAIVRQSNTFMIEGFMYRHHPQILTAKQAVMAGEIGDITYMNAHLFFSFSDPSNWRTRKDQGGGAMMDQGGYMVNLLNFMLDRYPEKVFCRSGVRENGLDCSHTATLLYPQADIGVHFHIDQHSVWSDKVEIFGTKGSILLPNGLITMRQERTLYINNKPRVFDAGQFPFLLQLQHVYDCLFRQTPPRIPIGESVRNMHVIDALYESGRMNQVVTVR